MQEHELYEILKGDLAKAGMELDVPLCDLLMALPKKRRGEVMGMCEKFFYRGAEAGILYMLERGKAKAK